ncbi:cytochrome c-type biogenesis protein [Marinimicrobium locisalis]|uniref:cytochrome c-type biogenesis protein n=1 Tax=Marinimicrobium locisalis TaxID=546022 RepID=UPI003221619B
MSNHVLRINYIWCRWCLLTLMLAMGAGVQAAVDVREFDNEADRERYQSFIDELRCPKCQNQNLAGSDAPIAKDLRDQVYRLIQDGRSDKEIVDFMVERYGEYVLYRPPLSTATLVLWAGPPVVLIIGIIILIWVVRQRRGGDPANQSESVSQSELSADERAHLNEILNDTDNETPKR